MRDLSKAAMPKLVKIVSVKMQAHMQLLDGTPFKYRAPHANRPTPPRKRWEWGIEVNGLQY